MTREPAARCIFRFALPLMFGNLFQQVYTFADTVVVGQKLGMNALAALGSTEWMVFLAFGAIQGMTGGFCVAAAQAYGGKSFRKLGCAVFNAGMLSVIMAGIFAAVGQNVGARRSERIRQGMRSAAVLGCLTAVLMSAVMLFGGTGILKCFLSGETATVVQSLKIGTRFLRVLAAFFPFLYLLYILRAGIQGLGNGLIPMLSSAMQLIMRVICALFVTRLMGCAALFWGEAAAWLGADLLLLLFWKRTYLHVVSLMNGEL